jgi:hypothetical protein
MGMRQHEGAPTRVFMYPALIIDQALNRTLPCFMLPPTDPPLAPVLFIIFPVLEAARLGIVIIYRSIKIEITLVNILDIISPVH